MKTRITSRVERGVEVVQKRGPTVVWGKSFPFENGSFRSAVVPFRGQGVKVFFPSPTVRSFPFVPMVAGGGGEGKRDQLRNVRRYRCVRQWSYVFRAAV